MNISEMDINRVNLMMGTACNYHCRHCIQCPAKRKEKQKKASPEVIHYLKRLIALRPSFRDKLQIMFWGGEPLLYMPVIKDVISRLGDTAAYSIVTNGSLLTVEHVDYFNRHDVSVILSNDGEYTEKVRGENLLEKEAFVQLFQTVKHKGIDACISAYNQDFYALWNYIDQKLGGDIPISHELIKHTWDMPEDLRNFDLQAFEYRMRSVVVNAYKKLLNGEIEREFDLIYPTVKVILKVMDGKYDKGFLPRCSQMHKMISIDVDGNVYACHNGGEKLGTVRDEYRALLEKYVQSIQVREECRMCAFRSICNGGCPSETDTANCAIRKIFMQECIKFVKMIAETLEPVELGEA